MHLLPQCLPGINEGAGFDKDGQLGIKAVYRLLQFKGLAEGELVVLPIGAVETYKREALGQKVQIAGAELALIITTECRRKFVHKSH
jgi:hypothetical protein